MFAIPFSFLSLPFLSFHAPGKIPTIPASAPPFPTRGSIENDSVEGIYASWRAISEILYLGFVRFFFYLSEESRRYIFAPSTSSVRSIIWKEKIYRGTVELAHVTGRFLNNSRPRHMSEAHPIFRPSCLEMVVLRITTWSG